VRVMRVLELHGIKYHSADMYTVFSCLDLDDTGRVKIEDVVLSIFPTKRLVRKKDLKKDASESDSDEGALLDLDEVLDRTRRFLQDRFGDPHTETIDVFEQVLESKGKRKGSLVDRKLFLQVMKNLEVKLSNDEVDAVLNRYGRVMTDSDKVCIKYEDFVVALGFNERKQQSPKKKSSSSRK
jgi:Ca2+-binding EF-hand superfamily protein